MKTFITGLLLILSIVLLMITGIDELQLVALGLFAVGCGFVLGLFVIKIIETIKENIKK